MTAKISECHLSPTYPEIASTSNIVTEKARYFPNSALNDFELFKTFFILCFAVPEALRLLLHLAYQFMYTGDAKGVPWILYNSSFFIWLWDFIFRIVYVCIIILETSGTPGTFDFLKTQTNTVMRDYVTAMIVP